PDPAAVVASFVDLPFLIFLDSATGAPLAGDAHQLGRYSFLTADPVRVVRSKGPVTELADGAGGWRRVEGDALAVVADLLGPPMDPVSGLPPFQGGAAGYIGYDYGAVLERIPASRYDDLAIPDVVLGLYDWVVAWDHLIGTAWIISTGRPERGAARDNRARERLEEVRRRVADSAGSQPRRPVAATPAIPLPECPSPPSFPVLGVEGAERIGLRSSFTHRAYLEAVARVREYILAGDIFQANLSQRFEGPLAEPTFELYRRLRTQNAAPFAAFLDFPEALVLSASPERFLSVSADGRVETRPIKGTRPRGVGP